jgi:hypothetical protein
MDVIVGLLTIAAVVVAAAYAYSRLVHVVTVYEYQRGLEYKGGRFVRLGGNTIVLGLPSSTTPLPLRGDSGEPAELPPEND